MVAAIELGGATAVLARDLESLEASVEPGANGASLPFRFVVFGFDGQGATLRRLCASLRAGAQLIAVVPKTTLAVTIELLAETRCNHVVLAEKKKRI